MAGARHWQWVQGSGVWPGLGRKGLMPTVPTGSLNFPAVSGTKTPAGCSAMLPSLQADRAGGPAVIHPRLSEDAHMTVPRPVGGPGPGSGSVQVPLPDVTRARRVLEPRCSAASRAPGRPGSPGVGGLTCELRCPRKNLGSLVERPPHKSGLGRSVWGGCLRALSNSRIKSPLTLSAGLRSLPPRKLGPGREEAGRPPLTL